MATSSATPTPEPTTTRPVCVGDCARNFDVTIDEIITGVSIDLDRAPLTRCLAFDANHDQRVSVEELVLGVRNLLRGCP